MAELIKSVFVDFYRLSYKDLLCIMAAVTWCFADLHAKFRTRSWWRIGVAMLLVAFSALVVYATVTSRGGGHTGAYNLIPFHSYREVRNGGNPEIYRSNLMNVVMLYPCGLMAAALLPDKMRSWKKVFLVTVLFFLFSAGIETFQYIYRLGRVEIDDVIHNTLGALLGSLFGSMKHDR